MYTKWKINVCLCKNSRNFKLYSITNFSKVHKQKKATGFSDILVNNHVLLNNKGAFREMCAWQPCHRVNITEHAQAN